jgi:putative heme-binding domain-containing protein
MRGSFACFVLLCGSLALAADGPTAQIDRGRQLFRNSPKGLPCATCHSLEGNGTAVGPDLTRLAGVVGPRGLVMTIKMTMTAYVQQVSLKSGRVFPGIQKQKDGDTLDIYDLSKLPAVLIQVKASDVSSMKENTKWSHPPTSAGYTDEELADIISYLKFAATGVATGVSTADLR